MVRPTNQTIQRLFVMLTDPKRVTLCHGGHTGEQPGLSEAEGAGGNVGKSLCCGFPGKQRQSGQFKIDELE